MPDTPHEDRFIGVRQYMTGHELPQQVSMPRKAHRLDAVCWFGAAGLPGLSGARRLAFAVRVLLFEPELKPASAKAEASDWVGQAWIVWQRLKKPQSHRPVSG